MIVDVITRRAQRLGRRALFFSAGAVSLLVALGFATSAAHTALGAALGPAAASGAIAFAYIAAGAILLRMALRPAVTIHETSVPQPRNARGPLSDEELFARLASSYIAGIRMARRAR